MVFDTIAWGVTFLVGVVVGIAYERGRHLSKLLYDVSVKGMFRKKYIEEEKESEKVM